MPISGERLNRALEWYDQFQRGANYTQIADDSGVHRTTVMRAIRSLEGLEDRPEPDTFYTDNGHIQEWHECLARLNAARTYLTGVIGSDQHFVDHDPTAILLERQIIRRLKPDFSVFNGDVFDFPAIAKFTMSRHEQRTDVLKSVEPFYRQYVEDRLDVRLNMELIHNSGNHNVRLDSYLAINWQFEETIEDRYRDIVRQDGAVVMNDFIEEALIGPLLIQHGRRTNLHSYKSQAEDVAFGVDVVSGHKHVPGIFYKRQIRGYNQPVKVVSSAVTGCLCRLVPQYASHATNLSMWINGIAVVNVNPSLEDSHIQVVNFHPTKDGLYAALGGEVFFQSWVDEMRWWDV